MKYNQQSAHLFTSVKAAMDKNTVKKGKDECWLWTGTTRYTSVNQKRKGGWARPYLKVQIDNVRPNLAVHIVAYNREYFPYKVSTYLHKNGDEYRRTCGTPLCVNPYHIEVGNRTDTVNCMEQRGTTQKRNQHAKKYDHEAIRHDRANGMSYAAIMKKYNIPSKGTVSHIINKALELDK